MAIKVVALDVYGTIVSSRHADLDARNGLDELFDYAKKNRIYVVTASDADEDSVKESLTEARVDISRFHRHFQLQSYPKEFYYVTSAIPCYGHELLVIGDKLEADIDGAVANSSKYIHVWKYEDLEDKHRFDFQWAINAIKNADKVGKLEFDLSKFAVKNPRKNSRR